MYNVRYAFINLGQVRIVTLAETDADGVPTIHTKAFINSYSGIPFVSLNAIFESWIDKMVFSRVFVGRLKEGKAWYYSRYRFDYENNLVLVESGRQDTLVEKRGTVEIEGTYQDGLSIFFFAREHLHSAQRMNVRTFVKEQRVNTFLNFGRKKKAVEIDLVDYRIDAVEFDGAAEFEGIYGLTGGFEGWFSNDDARVPILAKMKVFIGSVTLELMKYTRQGWTPPKAR